MRGLARFVATSTLVIGCLASGVLILVGLSTMGDYGGGAATLLFFGWASAVFLTAGASACILSLLASIDERLQVAGHRLPSDSTPGSASSLDDRAVWEAQVGLGADKKSRDSSDDPDLESKLEFERTHGKR